MKHILLLALFYLFSAGITFSQTTNPVCPSDFWRQKHLQDTDFQQLNEVFEQQVLDVFQQKKGHQGTPEQIRTVPVVVHIIHDNGPENLSDAKVQQAIQWLNEALTNQGVFDQGSGANTEIQLCFAQRTPAGQASNGITRDQSTLTEMQMESQDLALKNLNRWNPKDYINIWVVRSICSVTYGCNVYGYANYPFAHGSNIDGIVIEANYLSGSDNIRGLAHEIGHYFGLYHTFEGGCANNNCMIDGDRVCDTPPDQSTVGIPCGDLVNTCSTDTQSGPFSTNQPDMTWNYMDYGHLECFHDYTPDQAARMNAALDGKRHSLLESKGCLQPCPGNPVAAFNTSATTINIGGTVNFHSTSANAAAYQWTVDGINFGNQINASYAFNTLGTHTVTLTVYPANSTLCDPDQVTVNILVVCPVQAEFSLSNLSPEQNDTVQILNQTQNAAQTNWYLNGVSLGNTPDSIVFTTAGIFEVQLIASNGFCADTASVTVEVHGFCVQKTFDYRILSPIGSTEPRLVALTDGNFILHYYYSELSSYFPIICKISPFGKMVWSKRILEDSPTAYSLGTPLIEATADNDFVVVRNVFDTVSMVLSYQVEQFNSDGTLVWAKKIDANTADFNFLMDVTIVPDGILLTGNNILIKLDLTGEPLWVRQGLSAQLIRPYPDGGCIILEYNSLLRMDATGAPLWRRALPPNIISAGIHDMAVTPAGEILLCGDITPPTLINPKGLLMKLDENGATVWLKYFRQVPVSQYDFNQITLEPDGDIIVAGNCMADTPAPIGLQPFTVLLKIDLDANVIWSRHYPNPFTAFSLTWQPGSGFVAAGLNGINAVPSNSIRILKTDFEGRLQSCEEEPSIVNAFDYYQDTQEEFHAIIPASAVSQPAFSQTVNISVIMDTLCAPACQVSFEICNNNIDDDGDGLFDCIDPECACARDRCLPRYSDKWFFGNQTGLDFQSGKLKLLPGGQTEQTEAYSSICDAKGNLLFYTDGLKVYNRFHEMMPNGDLGVVAALTQVLIIPHPGQSSLYYLFGIDAQHKLRYSLISMALENGKGDIMAGLQLINVNSNCNGLTAIASCGFNGFWMLTYEGSNKVLVYRIDQTGLLSIPLSYPVSLNLQSLRQLKLSSNGHRVACSAINAVNGLWSVALFDFNPFTAGVISNPEWLDEVGSAFEILGVEFSPNSRFLYLSGKFPGNIKVRQYDLEAGDINAIRNSRINLAFLPGKITGYLQLAPDGKIYASSRQNIFQEGYYLDVIHRPDQAGAACQFEHEAIDMSDLYPPGGGVADWLPNVIAGGSYKPRIQFPMDAPDTICALNVPVNYPLKTLPCSVGVFQWETQQLSATVVSFLQSAQLTFTQPGHGKLIVSLTDECGFASDTLDILVADQAPQTLDLGPDITVCQNGVFTLHAGSGFARYLWSDNTADSTTTTLQPGQYWVKAWDACGNLYSDTIQISVAPNSVLDLGEIPVQCPGFTQSFQRPAGFTSWQWAPADFLNCTNCPAVTIQPDQTTVWTILATTAEGCISVDTLQAFIRDTLPFQLDTFICANLQLNLFGTALPPDTTAQFFFPRAGVTCDTLWTVNVMPQDNPLGTIDITICPDAYFNFHGMLLPADTTVLAVVSQMGECDSLITITIHAYPELSLQLPQDTTIKIGAAVLLETQITGANPFSLQWTPAESLSCSDCPDPLAGPLDTLTYFLSVTDANGCTGSGSVTLRVQEICRVQVPNAFSPNGDGANDIFRPICDPCVKTVLSWRIFNRWGQNVFSQFNYPPADSNFGWDGSDQDGKAQASDVYIWTLEVEYYDGRREQFQNQVTLVH